MTAGAAGEKEAAGASAAPPEGGEAAGEPTRPPDDVGDAGQANPETSPEVGGDGAAGAPERSLPAAVAALQEELESVRQQLLRVHADFDNFRRRTRQEREELQQFAARKLLEELLPVVDNFERALASVNAESQADSIRTGIEMVYRQLTAVLERQGVQPMNAAGQPFDPNFHQAVMQEPAAEGQPAGLVVEELQRGYLLHGKVLRPALVKVSV
ncbi:MAG: nucleotide exchange factor GrpE [Alicyclobacillaceae bacterium]|nr:nucleotide exchange factor GrpE [Alicyclobacillaceae bacterium]